MEKTKKKGDEKKCGGKPKLEIRNNKINCSSIRDYMKLEIKISLRIAKCPLFRVLFFITVTSSPKAFCTDSFSSSFIAIGNSSKANRPGQMVY